jgi:hypothetical protein
MEWVDQGVKHRGRGGGWSSVGAARQGYPFGSLLLRLTYLEGTLVAVVVVVVGGVIKWLCTTRAERVKGGWQRSGVQALAVRSRGSGTRS